MDNNDGLDDRWYYFCDIIVSTITLSLSIIATSVTIVSFLLFNRKKLSDRSWIVLILLTIDFISATSLLVFVAVQRGDYNCTAFCKVIAFIQAFVGFLHGQTVGYICETVHARVVRGHKTFLKLRHFMAISCICSLCFSLLPLLGIPHLYYVSMGWWAIANSDVYGVAFIYLAVPVCLMGGVVSFYYMSLFRKIRIVAKSAPSTSAPAYQKRVLKTMLLFPVAFVLVWSPVVLWHVLYYFEVYKLHTTTAEAMAIACAPLYRLAGLIDALVYMKQHDIITPYRIFVRSYIEVKDFNVALDAVYDRRGTTTVSVETG